MRYVVPTPLKPLCDNLGYTRKIGKGIIKITSQMGQKKIEYSIKNYIELEQSGDIKYEYYDGEIYALAGGTINHGMICTNVSTLLQNNLKDTDCVAINSEVKIFIEKNNAFVYPDASVICGEIKVSDKDKNAITNPVLIVEVLSDSTKKNDRGRKFFRACWGIDL